MKTTTKKPAAKPRAAKKTAPKKPTAKRPTAKQPAAEKPVAKKTNRPKPPVSRRNGREWALQALVQFDLNPPEDLARSVGDFWAQLRDVEADDLAEGKYGACAVFTSDKERTKTLLESVRTFAEARIRGVMAERDALDHALEPFLRNWSVYRLGTVERNVLRLGAWEILNCGDIPAPIVVNEAVDLAKFFSETPSGRFVNGVLDAFAKAEAKKNSEGTYTP